MKILLLCNKSPYPAREGGPIAMNMIVEGLIRAGHSVKVLAVNSNKYSVDISSIPEDYRTKTGIELVYVDLSIRPLAAFRNLFSTRSYHVERFISRDLENALIRILQSEKFDIVQFEMLYMSPYAGIVRKYSDARIVLRAHNIEHLIWQRVAATTKNPLKRLYLNSLISKLKKYECSVVRQFDGIVAITEQDAAFFRSSGCWPENSVEKRPVIAIPFGIDPELFRDIDKEPEFPSLFSIGAMDWIPNREGIWWFLEQVWPEIHRRFPELHYYLAGRNMPESLREKALPNVEVVGEVEDALTFMQSKAILIVPLFSGSGIRIKIIEGMATGKAIISTRVGAEGIHCTHGKEIFLADTVDEFVRCISDCVRNKALCETMGRNARNLIFTGYNRDLIISNLVGFYQKIRG
ncbi:MAG: glycosyltransferase family 4 protein [Bacteroidetes bacterium]|nr:glycosyltransferase family 4 protein [Bacteroidota bacterium]